MTCHWARRLINHTNIRDYVWMIPPGTPGCHSHFCQGCYLGPNNFAPIVVGAEKKSMGMARKIMSHEKYDEYEMGVYLVCDMLECPLSDRRGWKPPKLHTTPLRFTSSNDDDGDAGTRLWQAVPRGCPCAVCSSIRRCDATATNLRRQAALRQPQVPLSFHALAY